VAPDARRPGLRCPRAGVDHSIVVGRVRRLQVSSDGDLLVYFAGGFGSFEPD
jgi:flavin reductase (DIM6/NTAB) family NADH-FMN oxidoreductase RutF